MAEFENGDVTIAYDVFGEGTPLVMLHGFPQTRALWSELATILSSDFQVIMPDLRGYGASSKPAALDDIANYSFRAMGEDVVALLAALGHDRFHLVGHDRGGRVAYRLARDNPNAVKSLTLMDIVPTDALVEAFGYAVAKAYFHWSFLAQPAPFPEHMIEADPDHFFEACLIGWGGAKLSDFPQLDAYRTAWRNPSTIAGMANDYRAAVGIDLVHDSADDGVVRCPALVLYGEEGVMARHYDIGSMWAARLPEMTLQTMPGGHFFVDQQGKETARRLFDFLAGIPD